MGVYVEERHSTSKARGVRGSRRPLRAWQCRPADKGGDRIRLLPASPLFKFRRDRPFASLRAVPNFWNSAPCVTGARHIFAE